ncbi:unnamed protein product [Dracunculus medinensis]|uniref:GDP-fucose protein O-fucosyltransferase 1 n=1 Tax=Dracunculus medinensis TaxID=318479 RepID=A0A0N4U635_DRAME|nr:unnamed protein product [Dracunculus medinensis]
MSNYHRLWPVLCTMVIFTILSGRLALELANDNGYVMYCPCMGRFGNQIEQLLGSISFARILNRTLVLPPFIEYHRGESKAVMIDFDRYFLLEPFRGFVDVMSMQRFMNDVAPLVWPPDRRIAFCWSPRKAFFTKSENISCHAKDGNPFGPFWDHFGIDFVGDIFYGSVIPNGYNIKHENVKENWMKNFPPSEYPVLSFISAPAPFPSLFEDQKLQKYLQWNAVVSAEADNFIAQSLKRPFIGIHLRNDVDWVNVCENVEDGVTKTIFASAQCTGYFGEHGSLTKEMCFPPLSIILNDTEYEVKRISAKSVFVSSDRNHYIDELNQRLAYLKVIVQRLESNNAHLSLAILGKADHFIGNCVSTFSSFVVRERHFAHESPKPSSFFAFRKRFIKEKIEL